MLERNLISDEELDQLMNDDEIAEDIMGTMADPRATRRAQEIIRDRSPAWVLGTSLAFEAFILLVGLWIFRRRDL